MPKVVIDDLEFNSEDLSAKGSQALIQLHWLERKLFDKDNELASLNSLKEALILQINDSLMTDETDQD